jgi:hypothetical protein
MPELNKPYRQVLVVEIEDSAFEKDQPEFESMLNLELHVSMKDLREAFMKEYESRKNV